MSSLIKAQPLSQKNPFQQTLDALEASLKAWGNFKKLIKDLNIISYKKKMNAGIRASILANAGHSPTLVVSPSELDLTQMLAFTNCHGRLAMGFDFTLFDKGNNVDDILEITWQLLLAINQYGDTLGLPFIYSMQWQVGSIGQAVDAGIFEGEIEGWSSFQSLLVSYSINKEELNINTK
ncbi:MAG: hypothetical protein MJK13_04335 [Pseudomonadales bacterium]|nr:hypothetical protein [Pseudomonadales bacterium]NQZ06048.1 hypothetical protein [Algicola sp.]